MEDNQILTGEDTHVGKNGEEIQKQAQENAGKDGKFFTQEEVNSFVQSRIARLKAQASKEARMEYDQKLAELQAREMHLLVKEKLRERNMPKDLADVITCTDEADLDKKLNALQKIYGDKPKEEKPSGFLQIGADRGSGVAHYEDPVREAMGLKKR